MPLANPGHPPEDRAIEVVHAALDAGVELLDTADAYCEGEHDFGRGERLVAKALRGRSREGLIVTPKGGHTRPGGRWELDGRPEYLRRACEASLERLETDRIDLYQLHRPDPKVPYAESVGALRDLRDEGKIRWVGLSNANVAQLEEAEGITPIDAIQNQLSLRYPDPVHKGEVAACEQRGIPFLAWAPLGGAGEARKAGSFPAVADAAAAHGVSPQRVALAWLMSLSPVVVPIPGSTRPETIRDSVAATRLELSPGEVAAIDADAGVTRS
jgi:aryl-alcohol dehydrogenase-like predicted oxidoreductase